MQLFSWRFNAGGGYIYVSVWYFGGSFHGLAVLFGNIVDGNLGLRGDEFND